MLRVEHDPSLCSVQDVDTKWWNQSEPRTKLPGPSMETVLLLDFHTSLVLHHAKGLVSDTRSAAARVKIDPLPELSAGATHRRSKIVAYVFVCSNRAKTFVLSQP